MREELSHLIQLGSSRGLLIQVVPFTAGVNSVKAFLILEFPDPTDNDIVYIEGAPITSPEPDR